MAVLEYAGRFALAGEDIDQRFDSLALTSHGGSIYLAGERYGYDSPLVFDAADPEAGPLTAPFSVTSTTRIELSAGGHSLDLPASRLEWLVNAAGDSGAGRLRIEGTGHAGGTVQATLVPDGSGHLLVLSDGPAGGLSMHRLDAALNQTGAALAQSGHASGVKALASSGSMVVTGTAEGGLSLYEVSASGFTHLGAIGTAQGLGMGAITGIETIQTDGTAYAAVTGASGAMAVLELTAAGPELRDFVLDDRTTRFDDVAALRSFALGGHQFLIAGGGDQGLSLMQLLPGGRLVQRHAFADTLEAGLGTIQDLAVHVSGASVTIFAASQDRQGIAELHLDAAQLGQSHSAQGMVSGGALNDVLSGSASADRIDGHAGDDILFDRAGNDTLSGGAGGDLFILDADGRLDEILDFDPSADRLDLGAWGLYSAVQLNIDAYGGGARLRYGDETLLLRGVDPETLDGLELAGMGRPPVMLFDPDAPVALQVLSGGASADRIEAATITAWLQGGAGFDMADYGLAPAGVAASLRSPGGNTGAAAGDLYSQIEGIAGSAHGDHLQGNGASNLLEGAGGNDTLDGHHGRDVLDGGTGADLLRDSFGGGTFIGGDGGDRSVNLGGAGEFREADTQLPSGAATNDVQLGGYGSDTMAGGAGDDLLIGDHVPAGYGGADRLTGGTGDDMLMGGDGEDVFVFRPGDGDDIIAQFSAIGTPKPLGADFRPGADHILLEGFRDIDSPRDALAHFADDARGNAHFSLQGTEITLWGVSADSLSAGDFLI